MGIDRGSLADMGVTSGALTYQSVFLSWIFRHLLLIKSFAIN
jgi:hypothetical protein